MRPAAGSGSLYLAIDQGGHASRALVFDAHGGLVAQASRTIETFHPARDRVEHDPEALVDSIARAVREVAGILGGRVAEIKAAGLATQRSSIVCWDRQSGTPLSPVLSWQDRRAAAWLKQFEAREPAIQRATGLVLSPHYGAGKLRWCLDHIPEVRDARGRGRLACGPLASFLLFRLLNERPFVVDAVNASRTQLLDLQTLQWSRKLLDWFGLQEEFLPCCVANRSRFGMITAGAAEIPMTIVTGDQPAALYALGEPKRDILYVNLGTGAFVQGVTAKPRPMQSRLLQGVVLQEESATEYVVEGTVNGAGSALREIGDQLGLSRTDVKEHINDWLAESADPPLFMNGVSGLGSPFWVSEFRSGFLGDGEPWDRMAAVVESIVFLLQENIERMCAEGFSPRRIMATGGLVELPGLIQRLADVSGFPVMLPRLQEATSMGLAYLLCRPAGGWAKCETQLVRPGANTPLQRRFGAWRRAMEARIGRSERPA